MHTPGKNHARLGLLLALLASPLATQELATEGALFDDSKSVGFPKPVDWKFIDVTSQPLADELHAETNMLSFTARTVNYGRIFVQVRLRNGVLPSNRLEAIADRASRIASGHAHDDKYELSLKPLPHGVYCDRKSPESGRLLVHRRSKGRSMTVAFSLSYKTLVKAKPLLLELASKVTCNTPLWPSNEAGYEFEPESGIQIAFNSSIAKKYRKSVHKMVKTTVKDFTKQHGAPHLLTDEPVILYVDSDDEKKAALLKREKPAGHGLNHRMRRLVAPILDGDWNSYCWCTGDLYRYLLTTLYPSDELRWIISGEEAVARSKVYCKKALPSAPASWLENIHLMRMTIAEMMKPGVNPPFDDACAWVIYFRLGPAKHRKAYQQMMLDLRTTTDSAAVVQAFMKSVDAENLRTAARKLLKKRLKPIKKT